MRSLVFLILALTAAAIATANATEPLGQSTSIAARREKLEAAYQEKLGRTLPCLRRGYAQTTYFLPDRQFDVGDNAEHQKLTRFFAKRLTRLAMEASENGDAIFAWQTLNQASFFGDPTAAKIVGPTTSIQPVAKLSTSAHPRLKWKRKSFYRIESEHYQVVSRDQEAGLEIARRLETLYAVWGQIFFECWSSPTRLKIAIERQRTIQPRSRKRTLNRVVLFANRAEYNEYLRDDQPQIEMTLGFYDVGDRTSYFFGGEDSSISTQIHEATHQLFQEVQSAVAPNLMFSRNFWAIEGVALYMESLQSHDSITTVGGILSNRMQFARYRRIQEQFYVPLAELVTLSRSQLQRDERIRRIYSQSAGLTHFLMDAENAKHRKAFIAYLRQIYQGRDRTDSLNEFTGTALPQLDEGYRRFLSVTDDQLTRSIVARDSLKSLCLGGTEVTNAGLQTIPPQSTLDWLDIAGTSVTEGGLSELGLGTALQQVSFDRTRVGDRIVELLANSPNLDELDLSNTDVTDDGIARLIHVPNLRVLWLSNTNASDASIETLSQLASLQYLAIDGTAISGAARQRLQKLLPNLKIE